MAIQERFDLVVIGGGSVSATQEPVAQEHVNR
jgi:hypothetical protein